MGARITVRACEYPGSTRALCTSTNISVGNIVRLVPDPTIGIVSVGVGGSVLTVSVVFALRSRRKKPLTVTPAEAVHESAF